ncbi:hypothetical protein, partial [Candidatus Thiosymbion oneisti]|uniref:hypothetical protein n=1 Tax=Candidatus Thiosymbion oneisti TaxID=589554 RepID=UPI001C40296D
MIFEHQAELLLLGDAAQLHRQALAQRLVLDLGNQVVNRRHGSAPCWFRSCSCLVTIQKREPRERNAKAPGRQGAKVLSLCVIAPWRLGVVSHLCALCALCVLCGESDGHAEHCEIDTLFKSLSPNGSDSVREKSEIAKKRKDAKTQRKNKESLRLGAIA